MHFPKSILKLFMHGSCGKMPPNHFLKKKKKSGNLRDKGNFKV